VVYFSATGNTAQLAHAIAEGAALHADVVQARITGAEVVAGRYRHADALELVDQADAVIFGSPTYMGGPAAEFKAFADASSDRWTLQRWRDKVAAGFSTGGSPNGDQSYTLTYFSVLAAQHGMHWCNLDIPGGDDPQGRNRLGTQVGLACQVTGTEVLALDLETGHYLGKRVATLAWRLLQVPPDPC
jgi:multimeric flavodoxin WrbA